MRVLPFKVLDSPLTLFGPSGRGHRPSSSGPGSHASGVARSPRRQGIPIGDRDMQGSIEGVQAAGVKLLRNVPMRMAPLLTVLSASENDATRPGSTPVPAAPCARSTVRLLTLEQNHPHDH